MRRSPLRTQVVALGILMVASIVGNVSLSASRVHSHVSIASIAATTHDGINVVSSPAKPVMPEQTALATSHGAADPGPAGQIVPAIYSWDPDVTFIFYRHFTKWM